MEKNYSAQLHRTRPKSVTATPKHRWYQFSLKTLLVGMTVLCIGPGGYVAYEQSKARRQKAAVEAIEKLGGGVDIDTTVPQRSATMRQILGDESFGNVHFVSFNDTQVTDADLEHRQLTSSYPPTSPRQGPQSPSPGTSRGW